MLALAWFAISTAPLKKPSTQHASKTSEERLLSHEADGAALSELSASSSPHFSLWPRAMHLQRLMPHAMMRWKENTVPV